MAAVNGSETYRRNKSAPTRRPRRSSGEVRSRILEGARAIFAEKGYAGATTKEIAARAEVAETVIFRIHVTKEALYEAAVLQPFEEFLTHYTARWMDAPLPGGTPEDVLQQFVEELHDLVREHRQLFAALASSDLLVVGIQPALNRLASMGQDIADTHHLAFDSVVATRVATVMVVAVTMLADSIFPAELGVGRDRLVTEMVRILVGATRYVPSS